MANMSSSTSETVPTTEKNHETESTPVNATENDSGGTAAAQVSNPTDHSFPEGGTKAWLVVLGCWCTSFASFGYVNSFGSVTRSHEDFLTNLTIYLPYRVYETYYLETFLQGHSPSDVAWIGSIQAFSQFSATLISGPVTDRYGPLVRFSLYILNIFTYNCRLTDFVSIDNYLAILGASCRRHDAHKPVH